MIMMTIVIDHHWWCLCWLLIMVVCGIGWELSTADRRPSVMDTDPDLYYPGGINMVILITMMVAVINEYHNDCDDSLYWWQWLDMGCNGQWRSNDQDGHESWYMTGIWMLMLMCWWRSHWQWECQWLREPPFLSRAVNDPSQSRMIIMI